MLATIYIFLLGAAAGGFITHFYSRWSGSAADQEHYRAYQAMVETKLARERMLLSMEQAGVVTLVRDKTGDLTGDYVLPQSPAGRG